MKAVMSGTKGIALACVLFLTLARLTFGVGTLDTPGAGQSNVVLCILENKALTPVSASLAEQVVAAELRSRRYEILPTAGVPRLSLICPADVRSVWNMDRHRVFQHYFPNANVLWMAVIDYQVQSSPQGGISGQVAMLARAFDAENGASLWYAEVPAYACHGADAAEAARNALAQGLPKLVDDFHRIMVVNKVALDPGSPPQVVPGLPRTQPGPGVAPLPPGVPEVKHTDPKAPARESSPYTGILVDTRDFPVTPSYRSYLYSPEYGQIRLPQGRRMTWTDPKHANEFAGKQPLTVRPSRIENDRIVLHPGDARRVRQESARMQGPVTIMVRPPNAGPSRGPRPMPQRPGRR